ncbi:hypothetical protein SAMN04489835_4560 [Mycolicibacterium rutilum]|uniref:Uncharacterized protein n=1 Tax=Mycolicibacterium rutilum TaxID=370526 RepID=A0A1H6L2I8_MYCRU|nr:hypothetical protein [Mycolicibacterium rutilum]SEH82343.1 hypothetical protein SAMN04489835_4560 [Mycolicibacterium rutilum]
MDPRRIELSRRHSREVGALFDRFLEKHPDIEAEADDEMTEKERAAWAAYSAELLTRHRAERSALGDQIEAERS